MGRRGGEASMNSTFNTGQDVVHTIQEYKELTVWGREQAHRWYQEMFPRRGRNHLKCAEGIAVYQGKMEQDRFQTRHSLCAKV